MARAQGPTIPDNSTSHLSDIRHEQIDEDSIAIYFIHSSCCFYFWLLKENGSPQTMFTNNGIQWAKAVADQITT